MVLRGNHGKSPTRCSPSLCLCIKVSVRVWIRDWSRAKVSLWCPQQSLHISAMWGHGLFSFSPRSPFTLNHPVVFHFGCHFTSPLIVSSVSFSTPPSVSVLPRSDGETSLAFFSPRFATVGNLFTLFFFSVSQVNVCFVIPVLSAGTGKQLESRQILCLRLFKIRFLFRFAWLDLSTELHVLTKTPFCRFFVVCNEAKWSEKQIQREQERDPGVTVWSHSYVLTLLVMEETRYTIKKIQRCGDKM